MSREYPGVDKLTTLTNLTNANVALVLRTAIGDTLRRARSLMEQREVAQAQRLYQGVLTMDPDNVEALHLLGIAYLQGGDAQRAEPLLRRSLQLGLRQAWNLVNHAAALVALARHTEALALLDQALRLDPTHAPTLAMRGNALLALERHSAALAAYDQALRIAPGLAESWLNRGKVLRALHHPADALISLDRALKIESGNAEIHTHRGHVLRDLGRREDALHSYRLALVIQPKVAELLSLCAVVLTELGRALEAVACLDEALTLKPDDAQLLYQSCVALEMLHAYEELLKRSQRLLVLEPGHAAVWLAQGNALQGLRRYEDAVQAYRTALALSPEMKDALRNLAAALRMLGRYTEALEHYDRALAALGPDTELLYNRAVTLQQLERYDDALASYADAVNAPAESAQSRLTRAVALQQLRRDEAALECYRQACELDPNHAAARRSEAFCRLLMGDYEEGWRQHESRLQDADVVLRRRHADRPLWRGQADLAGKTVLLHAEQGYGDTLQFCRYASLVAARGATVVLEVPAALKSLLLTLQGVSQVVGEGDPTPSFDLQCPMMSLPFVFGTTLSTIPAAIPYLRPDAARRAYWRQRLDAVSRPGRLKIGLTWSGNPNQNNDQNRSMPLAALAPLYGKDATFISLQPAVRERDIATLGASGIVNFGAQLTDFADTAALIAALDLVISVDTSVAHLAGALGRPLWVLLCRVPDWRWMLDREESPWYPQARLFRQDKPGDWGTLGQRLAGELSC